MIARVSFADPDHIARFCARIRITSKDHGIVPLVLNGAQRYLMAEFARGFAEGVHSFFILKARQLGISTICLALTLYWMNHFRGTESTIVTDDELNREKFRTAIKQYAHSLPVKWRYSKLIHNRSVYSLSNRSVCYYQVAGKRKNPHLGQGKGINLLYATEVASWGDEDGVASLRASFAQHHPRRLEIFESTAKGFNLWYKMWQQAKQGITQRPIFIGWWRHEDNAAPKASAIYKTYWDGRLTQEECEWVREVWELYGYRIQSTQIAWWRWMRAERQPEDRLMYQNYPPTENYAFTMTGNPFFSASQITKDYLRAVALAPEMWRYMFGAFFENTLVIPSNANQAELLVWEPPQPHGVYCIGADPAYGSSDWADRFCVQVLRCYSDRLVQVAEYCNPAISTVQFAWIIAHLAGYYDAHINLEVTGPGQAVLNEMDNMQSRAGMPNEERITKLYQVVAGMKKYLYKKPDQLWGAYSAYHWKSSLENKHRMMNITRDWYVRGLLEVRSTSALEEMKDVVQEGMSVGGEGRAKDDRAVALGLAVIDFNDMVLQTLEASPQRYSYDAQRRLDADPEAKPDMVNQLFLDYIQRIQSAETVH